MALTGDLAYWDDCGRVVLQGRNDDLLKLRNGQRIHPNSVSNPKATAGIEDAAVILTEPFQSLLGLVITKESPEELMKKLKKERTNDCLPDKLKSVPSLPYNRNGKLQRHLLHFLVEDK